MGGKQLKPKGVFVYQGCIHRTTAVAPKVSNLFVKFWRRLDSSNKCLIFKQILKPKIDEFPLANSEAC